MGSEGAGQLGGDGGDGVDERLVEWLAEGRGQAEIARLLKRSPRTVRRRASDPRVRGLVAERQRAMARAAAGRFSSLLERATGVVEGALTDPAVVIRLRAANVVFDRFTNFRREVDLLEVIADLRRELDELKAQAFGKDAQ